MGMEGDKGMKGAPGRTGPKGIDVSSLPPPNHDVESEYFASLSLSLTGYRW